MTHVWLRSEQRKHEKRVCLTHEGAKALIDAGIQLSVEDSTSRVLDTRGYELAGAEIVAENSWPSAPDNAIVLGLKEIPESTDPLIHKHIMFGHAYKGQLAGRSLLKRFADGGGTLYDLEYLLDEHNRRIAAFGYWAGFAGAAVSVKVWLAQQRQSKCSAVHEYLNKAELVKELQSEITDAGSPIPDAIIIGALGRVGSGATDLCQSLGIRVTPWDIEDTKHGGPFPEILNHTLFLNCILANEGTPQFVATSAIASQRKLCVVGDIACDPGSEYNPIPIYSKATSWDQPVVRVCDQPVLDVMAIDNLPSMLPLESSIDFSAQLLPALLTLGNIEHGLWGKAEKIFRENTL